MLRVACWGVAIAVAVAAAPSRALAQPAEPTTEYLVKSGDTCLGIAVRILGDKEAVEAIHRANPGLGPLPHILKPGRIMRLPRKKNTPDAKLTGRSGDVRLNTAPDSAWDPAHRNASLFRTWRVSTDTNSAATIAFSDTKHLYLRAGAVATVDGVALSPARVTISKASLERGTARAEVANLAGAGALEIRTPAGVIALSAGGNALVSIADNGTVTIANVAAGATAKPIELRTLTGRVSLRAGTTIRITPLARPETPRALAAAPTWSTAAPATATPALGALGASLSAAWSAVPGATGYHVEVQLEGADGVSVLSTDVPPSNTSIALREVPAGRYRVRVSVIDADHIEGLPSRELFLPVIDIPVWAPGSAPPPPPDPAADITPPLALFSTTSPASQPTLAQGTALGGHHVTCTNTADSSSGAPLSLAQPGHVTIACTTADGEAVAPFAVDVVPVTASATTTSLPRGGHKQIAIRLDSKVALGRQWRVDPGPGLTCEAFDPHDQGVSIKVGVDRAAPASSTLDVLDDRTGTRIATLPVTITDLDDIHAPLDTLPDVRPRPRPAPRVVATRPFISAGAFAGWTAFPHGMTSGLELGDAPVTAYEVDSGAGAGMRGALWLRRRIFVELDAGLWPTGFVAADEPAWITSGHAVVGYQLVDGSDLGARAVAGAGGYALLGDATYARADADPDITWGATGTLRLRRVARDLSVRLDARHRIAPDRADSGMTSVFEVTIGIEAVVTRTSASR